MSAHPRVVAATLTLLVVTALPLGAGYLLAGAVVPTLHSRELPWITGRALGLSAYGTLTLLVVLGLMIRHPLAVHVRAPHPELRLRLHAGLATATILLLAAHLVVLALDRYAGVGWRGAFIPGASTYRPLAVGLGVVAFELLVLLALSAGLAGRRGTGSWYQIHRLALLAFVAAFCHGALAGSDTPRLRVVYLLSGAAVLLLSTSAQLARWRTRPAVVPVAARPPRRSASEATRS